MKNIPLTLYSRKGCERVAKGLMLVVCERWIGDGGKVLLTKAALLSRPAGLQADSHAGNLSPTDSNCDWNWLKPSVAPGYIFVWHPPASCGRTNLHRIQPRPQVKVIFRYLRPDAPVSLFFRLFTQVHHLIDGSVEGQYVTKLVQNGFCAHFIRMMLFRIEFWIHTCTDFLSGTSFRGSRKWARKAFWEEITVTSL